jgi:hypothetical protein
MKPATRAALARQHSGGPSPVPAPCAVVSVTASIEAEIARLLDRSTQELRLAWRDLYRTGPPLGLSRDLLIRALAYELQERAHGGASAALRRRLQSLAGASEKGALAVDSGIVLTAGTTLVRQWRGHTHTVLVHKDGLFEHEGQRYRSLTVIAERITGAHWSGPRFFGLTKRAPTSRPAEIGQ